MSFRNIHGQDRQIAVLTSAIERDRLAHAYLFHGMAGVGKRTAAETFAKALNCEKGGTDSCDCCASCRKIDHGTHVDVITLRANGALIKIDQIRELRDRMSFRPLEAKRRVVIIDQAEAMNGPSQNAFLKTLEEPRPLNIMVLVTSRPHQLAATIVSRCQRVRFSPLRRKDMTAALLSRGMDFPAAEILAASSGGSVGRAITLSDTDYIQDKGLFIERLEKLCDGRDPLTLVLAAGLFGDGREKTLEKLSLLRSWYRDLLVFRETGEEDRLFHSDMAHMALVKASRLQRHALLGRIDAVNRAHKAVEQNVNRQIVLEAMLLSLAE
ncbi:MAG: DNA polymerase III subunit delta' [Deltaproteobacteria bacterium]|nr:DNA polymerase III subunit delta' [Deltaproteobacteria bacterium]